MPAEDTSKFPLCPGGSKLLDTRTSDKRWEGPHVLIAVYLDTSIVHTQFGRSIYRSAYVRPYTTPLSYLDNPQDAHGPPPQHSVTCHDAPLALI